MQRDGIKAAWGYLKLAFADFLRVYSAAERPLNTDFKFHFFFKLEQMFLYSAVTTSPSAASFTSWTKAQRGMKVVSL